MGATVQLCDRGKFSKKFYFSSRGLFTFDTRMELSPD
jgi:hypothetical protein